MKANVIGWYGHGNIGDESYKLSFPKLFPNVEFAFTDVTSNACDNYILGGGDILHPPYVDQLLNAPAKRRMIISASANPQITADLSKIDQIFVRDQRSLQILQAKGIQCTWMPDISTCLTPNPGKGLAWLKNQYQVNDLELYNKKVGVVLNAYLGYAEPDLLTREFLALMKTTWDLGRLCDNTSASFIFFPMSTQMPSDDRNTNSLIAPRCKYWRKNLVVYDKLSVQQTLNLISACDVVISTRLHSTIFSLISEVPFIDLTHHDKNKSYLKTANLLNYTLPYWTLDYEVLKTLLVSMLTNKERYAQELREIKNQHMQVLTRESLNVHFV